MKKDETHLPVHLFRNAQRLTDFVLQFDYETQEMWMRLFELLTKQALTEKETDEFGRLLTKLPPGQSKSLARCDPLGFGPGSPPIDSPSAHG